MRGGVIVRNKVEGDPEHLPAYTSVSPGGVYYPGVTRVPCSGAGRAELPETLKCEPEMAMIPAHALPAVVAASHHRHALLIMYLPYMLRFDLHI